MALLKIFSVVLRRVREKAPSKRLSKIYFAIFLNMFCSSFAITMLFPYLPFMMEFLIPRLKEDHQEVGKYVGIVGGSIFFGRIFGSYLWGVIADRKGRKPVLLVSNVCVTLATLAFGLSVNFGMAVVTRALMGFFNGMIPVAKAVMSEVTDDKSQAFGIAIVGTAWGTGYILGPAVAGAVADPIGQYDLNITNAFLHGLLTKFPYCLPSFVSVLLSITGFVVAIFFLPETLGTKKNRRRSEINQNAIQLLALQSKLDANARDDDIANHQNVAQTSFCEDEDTNATDETRLLESDSDDTEARTDCIISNPVASDNFNRRLSPVHVDSNHVDQPPAGTGGDEVEVTVVVRCEGEEAEGEIEGGSERRGEEEGEEEEEGDREGVEEFIPKTEKPRNRYLSSLLTTLKGLCMDLRLFFCNGASLNALLLYCVYSFGVIGFNELYSLWAYTKPQYGGLGFSLHEIGISMTFVGVFMLPVSLFAFPLLERRLKTIKTYYAVVVPLVFLVQMLPNIHYLVSTHHTWLLWMLLVTLAFLINGFFTVGFSAISLFINNSVTFDKLGSINGVAMMMTSVARALSPIVLGALYSVSLSDATLAFGFPVDYHLVFILISLAFLVSVLMVACMPLSINHQKIIEDV